MFRARNQYGWDRKYEEPSYENGGLGDDEDCELYALVFWIEGEEEFNMIAELIDPSLL
jgi:hypothetical protein